jgi:hypothetical protein
MTQVTDINHHLGVVGYHVRVATDIKLPPIVTFQLDRTSVRSTGITEAI